MGKRNRNRRRRSKAADKAVKAEATEGAVPESMSAAEITAAGLAIDVPFEIGEAKDMRYEDGRTLTEKHPELLDPDLKKRG